MKQSADMFFKWFKIGVLFTPDCKITRILKIVIMKNSDYHETSVANTDFSLIQSIKLV